MVRVDPYIRQKLNDQGGLLFILIDPLDYPDYNTALKTAVVSSEEGADALLIGGSIGVQGELLDNLIRDIKSSVSLPIILFPGNISTISNKADAIYFMSLLNSHSSYWITGAQMQAAFYIKKIGIEPLSVGYCVVEPGGTVGFVGQANLVPRQKPQIAASYALMSEMFGFKYFLTDSGSNAPSPVSPEFVSVVSSALSKTIYIVGGGIKSPDQARELISNGADVLQIGSAVENSDPETVASKVRSLKKAVLEGVKSKKRKRNEI